MTEYEQNIEIMKDLRNRIDAVLSSTPNTKSTSIPDPAKHKLISFIKSGFRIIAGGALIAGFIPAAGGLLILAELLGIAEEMV